MGLSKIALTFLILLPIYAFAGEMQEINPNYILYLTQTGDTAKALEIYKQYYHFTGHHDDELIEKIGLIILDQGCRSRDPEIQLLTLFGAGISANEKAQYILEDAIQSDHPQLQLVALNFLAKHQNDLCDEALSKAMRSNQLLVRLEAAYHLAAKKHASAVGQAESLMSKLNEHAAIVFPKLFAMIGDDHSIKILKRLMMHPNVDVRVETILHSAKYHRDDLLPQIRRLVTHHDIAQQEACIAALGILRDESSLDKLEKLSHSNKWNVKLAALKALYAMGRKESRSQIESMACEGNAFAITSLGAMPGSEEILAKIIASRDMQMRINAAIALLELHDARCLSPLCEVLLDHTADQVLLETSSIGRSLHAWKIVPSASQNLKDDSIAFEVSLSVREEILVQALELPEKDFIKLAAVLLESKQNDLIPALMILLENLQTPSSIDLLKKHQQRPGAPLVRNYCNLALYRLRQEGPYAQNLIEWAKQQQDTDLIRFRPIVPWEVQERESEKFQLTPDETSRLLVTTIESLVIQQDDQAIDVLISLIQNGNQKNKYALIGLLMRASE